MALSIANPISLPAHSTFSLLPTNKFSNVSVFWSKFVAVHAMSFCGIFSCKRLAAPQVFFMCDRFKVIWITALTVSAQVVNLQIIRYRAFSRLISISMSVFINTLVRFFIGSHIKISVSIAKASRPLPAAARYRLVYIRPKSLRYRLYCPARHSRMVTQFGAI